MENGIIFNHETKILLAEKLINVEFLVPFLNLDIQLHEHLNESVHTLQQLWKEPSIFCDLTFSSNFTTNDSVFDIDWILHHVQKESQLASTDLQNLRNEISILLHPNEEPHFGSQS